MVEHEIFIKKLSPFTRVLEYIKFAIGTIYQICYNNIENWGDTKCTM